ncbi:MAG: hypothetical protein NUV63_05430 [Gallionella sp.]|nr:hypothetical protein [Gallionella sp.]
MSRWLMLALQNAPFPVQVTGTRYFPAPFLSVIQVMSTLTLAGVKIAVVAK